jgi:hypothetical protein
MRMGRATPTPFNLEGVTWRSKGERRRSGSFSTAVMRKKCDKGKWGPAAHGITKKGEGVRYGLAQCGGGARPWTPS